VRSVSRKKSFRFSRLVPELDIGEYKQGTLTASFSHTGNGTHDHWQHVNHPYDKLLLWYGGGGGSGGSSQQIK
jgi:hypothetical protein